MAVHEIRYLKGCILNSLLLFLQNLFTYLEQSVKNTFYGTSTISTDYGSRLHGFTEKLSQRLS